MAKLDRIIHKYVVDEASGAVTVKEVKPIRTLMAKGRPDIHIQGGDYFYDGGELVPKADLIRFGLDPEMTEGAPTRMLPPPEVMEILAEGEEEALKEWAYDMKGGPKRGRK